MYSQWVKRMRVMALKTLKKSLLAECRQAHGTLPAPRTHGTDAHTHRHKPTQLQTHIPIQTQAQNDRRTDGQTDRQAGRQADTHTHPSEKHYIAILRAVFSESRYEVGFQEEDDESDEPLAWLTAFSWWGLPPAILSELYPNRSNMV
jgi:hypothetical protein